MTVLIYSDPHLGVNRTQNTTPSSRARLKEAIYRAALSVVNVDDCQKICCGDLFHNYSNPEEIILQGQAICEQTTIMLAGNHDVVARADKRGSLDLLSRSGRPPYCHFAMAEFNKGIVLPYSEVENRDVYVAIPHVTTQAIFEACLEKAKTVKAEGRLFLLLHCNYESPYETTETTLNLTAQKAEELLEVYDYIFIGHEHQPRDLHGGRVLVVGNTHPTGFADISDKFVLIVTEDGVHREKIWDAEQHYLQADVNTLATLDLSDTEFLRVVGDVKPEDMSMVAKQISQIWKAENSPYGIMLDTNILRDSDDITKQQIHSIETLPQVIEKELQNTELLELWKEFAA